MFAMDSGASMLGEVALVPKESPINRSGLLFMNTLFDENACCHVAVGEGFQEVIEGAENMTLDEIHALGVNDSIIHVDFMIGSDEEFARTAQRYPCSGTERGREREMINPQYMICRIY